MLSENAGPSKNRRTEGVGLFRTPLYAGVSYCKGSRRYLTTSVSQLGMRDKNVDVEPMSA